jgi:hypothetical protein
MKEILELTNIKCNNYELCKNFLSNENDLICAICIQFNFYKIKYYKTISCSICYENNIKGLKQPNCNHKICTNCFKRCYFGNQNLKDEPIFPYSEIEKEYFENPDDIKWINNYPLIDKYELEWSRWYNEIDYQYEMEEFLRKCPFCKV